VSPVPFAATLPTRRPRDVVVFSGGGPLGAAQAGMLRELMAAGVRPGAVVGCSVGALNAAFVAHDPTPTRAERLVELWHSIRTADVFPGSLLTRAKNLVVHHDRLCHNDALRALVRRGFPRRDLAEAAIPLHVVTTDLAAGRAAYHSSGDPADVLAASAAIPGVFPPVRLGDRLHVDGGVTALVPVRHALGLGGHVWVLDVAGPAPTGVAGALRALDVVSLAFSIAMRCQPDREVAATSPRVTMVSLDRTTTPRARSPFGFDHTGALVAAGAAAARAALRTGALGAAA
jgi:NTE family protein